MYRINLILQSIDNIRSDFLGFSFNISGFSTKIIQFLLVFLLFSIMYLLGRVIIRIFFDKYNSTLLGFFIKFAFGYIVVATLIFLLGFLSLLTNLNTILLLSILGLISIAELILNPVIVKLDENTFKPNLFKFIGIMIILVSFLRMLPPEPAGDPLDYHLRYPRIYLDNHSMMIPALGDESYINTPQLPEMLYIPSQIFTNGEASRIIHFGFFLLIFLLLYNYNPTYEKDKKIGPISAILFGISPLVLKLSSSAFSDFPALFCVIVSGYLLFEKKITNKTLILSGLLMGGALASKIWVLLYFPFYLIYIFLTIGKKDLSFKIKTIFIFVTSCALVVGSWYIRGILLVGNPFYINMSQGQNDQTYSILKATLSDLSIQHFLGTKFQFDNESAIIYIGIILIFFNLKKIYNKINKKYLSLIIILLIASLLIPVNFAQGRYTFPYIIPIITVISLAITINYKNFIIRNGFLFLVVLFISYYLFNTLLILPYGLGWANSNNYLKRNLIKDVAAYYDFNGEFTKSIKQNETVATYGMTELYYANFKYKNIYYFYNQQTHKLKIPNPTINKLLMRGGDIIWFCRVVKVVNCSKYNTQILASDTKAKQYLYKITYKD